MAKGASIKFKSYSETVPRLLMLLKLANEIKKYDKIILKPAVPSDIKNSTPKEFLEEVLKFCLKHKNPVATIFIAEGADGLSTDELFLKLGYKNLAEKYSISLIDLNEAETEEIINDKFLKFSSIHFPRTLLESFLIVLPKLSEDSEIELSGALTAMLGVFPASYYKGFFSKSKNKIRKWPIKYSIHDIIQCKIPDFAIMDASAQGVILAGLPLEIDKQSARLLGKNWKDISYLRLLEESLSGEKGEKSETSETT